MDTLSQIQKLSKTVSSLSQDALWKECGLETFLANKFKALSNGNRSASSEEFVSLVDALHVLSKTFESGLSNVRTILDSVHARTSETETKLSIESLPLEVISRIFEVGNEDILQNDFPFNVSQVNRRFRLVAMETPKMWSQLWIEHSSYRTHLLLERSKKAGLTIHLKPHWRLQRFLETVLKHSERWSSIWFVFGDADINSFRQHLPKQLDLPNLVEVNIEWRAASVLLKEVDIPFSSWTTAKLELFRGENSFFPNKVSLKHCSMSFHHERWDLRHISVDMSKLAERLRQAPRCVSLDLEFGRNVECSKYIFPPTGPILLDYPLDQEPAPFSQIKSLAFDTITQNQYRAVKSLVIKFLPIHLLRHLSIVSENKYIRDFLDFQHFFSLRTLTLRRRIHGYEDHHNVDQFNFNLESQRLPSLESVELINMDESSPLILDTDSHRYCLKELTFRSCVELDELYLDQLVTNLQKIEGFRKLCFIDCYSLNLKSTHERLEVALPGKIDWCSQL